MVRVAGAQVVVPPASEVPIPPKPATDTAPPAPDTIQPPFGRLAAPRTATLGEKYEWNREEMFASGALSVADLLERIPAATSFRTGWLASPKLVAVNGDFGRLRILYDGLEIDDIDPRNGSVLDLARVQLWTLEHVSVEQFANELIVRLRSWQVDRTTAYTRTDVSTGDEDSNLYRGFYGKRFSGGGGLQAGGQQYSTTAARLGGGGDALSLLLRAGIARQRWSVDAFLNRSQQTRVLQPTFGSGLSIPDFEASHRLAYLRAAYGDLNGGPWIQATASNTRLAETSRQTTIADAMSRRVVSDTADTATSRSQYLLSGGYARGLLRASAYNRIRSFAGETFHSPGARLELVRSQTLVVLAAERDGFRGLNRVDASFLLTPFNTVAVSGALSRSSGNGSDSLIRQPGVTAVRLEAGVKVLGAWLSAGYLSRDTALLLPPLVFDTAYVPQATGRRSAGFLTLRGRVYRDIGVDVVATGWNSASFYQPRYQARSEANLITRWISRFPSGNFGLKAAVAYDYRGAVAFPVPGRLSVADASGTVSALLEIRILRAVVSYQVRNIAGELYQTVPGFFMPRAINFYGVRWEFWN